MIYNMLDKIIKGVVMFVSSYNTYINTNTSQKSTRGSDETTKSDSKLFSSKLSDISTQKSFLNSNKPINYISQGTSQHNRELLRSQQEYIKTNEKNDFKQTTESIQKFSSTATLNSAKTAYSENSFMYSLARKPQPVTVDQKPKISQDMPQDLQELKEQKIRHTMVNTYIANNNYYQITA